jgi:hypothetical protein
MKKYKGFIRQYKRFYGETDGNAMIFVVLVLFTLVCFFVFTIHIGQRFTNKVEMQNAADAAVISGAIWKARGLNAISILNVSMSECLALIIMFMAFDSTMEYTREALPMNYAMAAELRLAGVEWTGCLNEKEDILNELYQKINEEMKKTWQEPKTLWQIMSALKKVSDAVSRTASVMAYLDASRMAELNGASALFDAPIVNAELGIFMPFATLWPYNEQLPVMDGNFENDLCRHTREGGDGYDNYLCYQNAFDVEVSERSINTEIEDLWNRLSACIVGNKPVRGIVLDEQGNNHTPLEEYALQRDQHYIDLCSAGDENAGGGEDYDQYKVLPLVLMDNFEGELHFTSLVQKLEGTVDSSYYLGSDGQPVLSMSSDISGEMITYGEDGNLENREGSMQLPELTWALASAEVYNRGEKDLFNQNWHAKLVPVDPESIEQTFMDGRLRLPSIIVDMESNAAQEILSH